MIKTKPNSVIRIEILLRIERTLRDKLKTLIKKKHEYINTDISNSGVLKINQKKLKKKYTMVNFIALN